MIAECIMAYITKSNSILMDCVFDVADLVMVGPFMLLIPLLYKPVTEKRPYGFSQVESLFVIIKYIILVVITSQLVISSAKVIFSGGNHVDAGLIVTFEMSMSVVCIIIYTILRHYNKKFSSPSIKADLYMWKMDVIGGLGVSAAFAAQIFLQKTEWAWVAPYIDPLVAIVMAVGLLIEPIRMIIEGLKNLVLFAPNEEIMEHIRETANEKLKSYPYTVSFLDVIQTGRKAWVEIYFRCEGDSVSIEQLRKAQNEIIKELKDSYDQINVELIPEILE